MVIFQNYGQELAAVQDAYERYKNCPPAARNMPPVAGNILWSRHLLRRIEGPMERFHAYPGVLHQKDSRKLIKTYNKASVANKSPVRTKPRPIIANVRCTG